MQDRQLSRSILIFADPTGPIEQILASLFSQFLIEGAAIPWSYGALVLDRPGLETGIKCILRDDFLVVVDAFNTFATTEQARGIADDDFKAKLLIEVMVDEKEDLVAIIDLHLLPLSKNHIVDVTGVCQYV